MKLIYEITVFLLINTLSLYLISNLFGEVLIRGQRLKEGGAYFKVREIHHVKFQNFVFVLFNNENETQNLKTQKKYQQWFYCLSVCITIPYEFIWILVLLLFQYGNFSYISAALLKGMLWIKVSESRYKQCGVTPHFSAGKNLLKKILREDTYWHIN